MPTPVSSVIASASTATPSTSVIANTRENGRHSAGHDLILLLGSEWSVYWPEVADKVQAEVALLHEAERRGIPVFGICFGNQVMAHAFGGSVFKADIAEIGWQDVETDVPDVIAAGPWMEWHYDVVSLPPGRDGDGAHRGGPAGVVAWPDVRHPVPSGGARRSDPSLGNRLRRAGARPHRVEPRGADRGDAESRWA